MGGAGGDGNVIGGVLFAFDDDGMGVFKLRLAEEFGDAVIFETRFETVSGAADIAQLGFP